MKDNTSVPLDRGPKGIDPRTVSVESARYLAASADIHASSAGLAGGRPAHTNGLFLGGKFTPSNDASRFTSEIFQGTSSAVVRFSPTRLGAGKGRYDIHGLAVQLGNGDPTQMVAINTEPFMFASADDFAEFVHAMYQPWWQRVKAVIIFLLRNVARQTSVRAMWRALKVGRKASDPLYGQRFFGIHTFFADRTMADSEVLPVPYRYELRVKSRDPMDGAGVDAGAAGVRAPYLQLADDVRNQQATIEVELVFILPWRWQRLTKWSEVPSGIRRKLISPIKKWNRDDVFEILMGSMVLDTVLDDSAFRGKPTAKKFDGMVFDPTRLSVGLRVSEDPLLRSRGNVYAESHMRRS